MKNYMFKTKEGTAKKIATIMFNYKKEKL